MPCKCPCDCCGHVGACCDAEGNCAISTCQECLDEGGFYQGDGTVCTGSSCPCDPPADPCACEVCGEETVGPRCEAGRTCCDGICCLPGQDCCADGCCYCVGPLLWRIVDSQGRYYGLGVITNSGGWCLDELPDFPYYHPLLPFLYGFTPAFYWDLGPTTFRLQIYGCNGNSWYTLRTWSMTIALCGTLTDRFPTLALLSSAPINCVPFAPPGDCACKKLYPSNATTTPCEPCDNIVCCYSGGSGLAFLGTGEAKYFRGAVDGEWTNLLNWEDANGRSPASSLPTSTSNVVISDHVTSCPTSYGALLRPVVNTLHITAGGSVSVAIDCSHLIVEGEVAANGSCPGPVTYDAFGTAGGGTCVFTNGTLSGQVIQGSASITASPASFDSNSIITGTLTHPTGAAIFNHNAINSGTITGDAIFNGGSRNEGTVTGQATFNDQACNGAGTAATYVPDPPPSC